MPELGWVPAGARLPAQPGKYLLRRDLETRFLTKSLREIRVQIIEGTFDGQCWDVDFQPDYWRDLPPHFPREN